MWLWESGAKVRKGEVSLDWLQEAPVYPAPIHLLLGVRAGTCTATRRGGLRVWGSLEQGHLQREVGDRPCLGSWVVLEAEKQLVSKAAGLVCTGGIVHVICVSINTRRVLVGCPPSTAAPHPSPQAP